MVGLAIVTECRQEPVLLTREVRANAPLATALEGVGFSVLQWPGVVLHPVEPAAGAEATRRGLADADVVVFVSPTSVRAAVSVLGGLGPLIPVAAAMGPATRDALNQAGVSAKWIAEPPSAVAMARVLTADLPFGARVHVLHGDRTRPELRGALEEAGMAHVGHLIYENRAPLDLARPSRALHAVVFSSPSAAQRHLAANPWLRNVPAVAIGATTAAWLEGEGCHPHVVRSATTQSADLVRTVVALGRTDGMALETS